MLLAMVAWRSISAAPRAVRAAFTVRAAVQVLTLGDDGGGTRPRKPVVAAGLTWEGAALLMTKLQHMHALRELRLPGLGAPLASAFMEGLLTLLADALRTLPALQVLDVRGLGTLSAGAAATLASALAASPALELADLSASTVGTMALDILVAQARTTRAHVLLPGYS